MAASVTRATSTSWPAWAAIISMTSPWISVESTSITISRTPRRCSDSPLDGEVDPEPDGLGGQQRSQGVGGGAGHVQLDRGHRVARHPLDPVDVGARVRDAPGDRGHRRRLQRAADQGDVGPVAAPALVVAGSPVDLDVHAELGGGPLDDVAQLLPVPRRGDEDAEQEAASQDDLLDVEDLDACGGQTSNIADVTPGRSLPVRVTRRVFGSSSIVGEG